MQLNVTQRGTWIDMAALDSTTLRRLQRYFTLFNKDYRQQVQQRVVYRVVAGRLYLPRFGAFRLEKKRHGFDCHFRSSIRLGEPLDELTWTGTPKPNQTLVINHIMAHHFAPDACAQGRAGVILNMEAGQGKTFVAIGLIAAIRRRTIVIVHNTSILQQWVKELQGAFPGVAIGVLSGTTKTTGNLQVAVINSLLKPTLSLGSECSTREFFKQFDLVVFDEAHEYCSKMRAEVFGVCQRPYMLGLSATPNERLDKHDAVAHWNIGPVLVARDLPGYSSSAGAFTARVLRVKYYGPDEFTQHLINDANEMASVPKIINQIAADPFRTDLVLRQALALLEQNHNVFVFADRRSYLEQLQRQLAKTTPHIAVCLLGGANDALIEYTESHARLILTTYQYMGTGKSIPKMDALVLATPRKSKSRQFIGRIFRLGGNQDIRRTIVDIVDMRTVLKNQWYERRKFYESKQMEVVDVDIKCDADCESSSS